MAFRVMIDDVPVFCDTPEDAVALARASAGKGKSKGTKSHMPAPTPSTGAAISRGDNDVLGARMLQIVANGGDHGVASATLAQGLGIKDAKGIGPIKIALRRMLAAHGMSFDDIIERRQGGPNGTKWHGKGRIGEALEKIGA
jgi:hypothetical protein